MKRFLVLALLMLLATVGASASVGNVYISQNGTGTQDGTSCATAKPSSFFNSAANWGTGATQIGPGSIVHACGSWLGASGSTALTFQGSGTSGNPITLVADSGVIFTSTAWGDVIVANNKSFLLLDGQGATIRNTGAGTNGSHTGSAGINASGTSNIEIRNWSILNLYVRTANSTDTCDCGNGIYINSSTPLNAISIHDNTISQMRNAIMVNYQGASKNVEVYRNTISGTANGLMSGDRAAGSTFTGFSFHDNHVTGGVEWDSPGDTFHVEHEHLWSTSSTFTAPMVYNNVEDGDCGGHCTAFTFIEGNIPGAVAFNNIYKPSGHTSTNAELTLKGGASSMSAYNNVVDCQGLVGNGIQVETNIPTANLFNNVVENCGNRAIEDSTASTINANGNVFFNNGGISSKCQSFSCWQGAGRDANGSTANPGLDATYRPTSVSSTVVGRGTNLSNLNIPALNSDASGVSRGSSWDTGAYQFGSGPPPGQITITTNSLPDATVGSPYTATLSSSGGTPPITWTSTPVVPGLTLLPSGTSSATLSGTPINEGTTTITFTASDANGGTSKPLPLKVLPLVPPPVGPLYTFWPNTTVPSNTIPDTDSASVELGIQFTASGTGQVVGVSFYKSAKSGNSHSATLWSNTGTKLATATSTNETASGWQTITFSSPVTINAGVSYTASYHTSYYTETANFFTTALNVPPLTAPVNAGVYAYGTTSIFPKSVWKAGNYWVQPIFLPASAPVEVTVAPAAATIPINGTVQFTATVSNTPNTGVTWSATCGSASSSGLFTAPGSPNTCNVKATSVADSTKSATAPVTVTPPPQTLTLACVNQGGARVCTITSTGMTGLPVHTHVNAAGLSADDDGVLP